MRNGARTAVLILLMNVIWPNYSFKPYSKMLVHFATPNTLSCGFVTCQIHVSCGFQEVFNCYKLLKREKLTLEIGNLILFQILLVENSSFGELKVGGETGLFFDRTVI